MTDFPSTLSLPCALWDVDGTLIDTTALIAASLDHVYQKYFQRTLPYDERRALIGIPLREQVRVFGGLEAFGIDEKEITEDFITYYETHRAQERVLTDVIAVLIDGKRGGLPTGLVTSKNREELANTLPRLGIAAYVDVIVSADDVKVPKPDPEGLRLALHRLAVPPERISDAVFIGDTVHDMRAAHAAGIRAVGVTWGAATRPRLQAEAPAFLCDTPEELRRLLP